MQLEHFVAAGDAVGDSRQLVGPVHRRERLQRHRHQRRMGDPGAVMAVGHFAQLVGADLVERGLVGRLVALDRDEGRHAAHGEGAAAVAGGDQAQRVGGEEGLIHGHRRAVGSQPVGRAAEALDVGENIVPAAAVEADDIVAKRVEDLVHLERGGQRFDQHRRLDRAASRGRAVPRRISEDVAPQRGFVTALQLGQIEIGAGARHRARPRALCHR